MQVRLPPAINDVVQRHTKWLKRKLYDQRERNGDIAFVFLPAGDAEAEAEGSGDATAKEEIRKEEVIFKGRQKKKLLRNAYNPKSIHEGDRALLLG